MSFAGDGSQMLEHCEPGGSATLNQYLAAGAIDELRLHIVPISLGAGERIFDGIDGLSIDVGSVRPTEHVIHVTLRRR